MFGQCRRIAENTTNRHPDNVIQQLMLRMQAKQNDSKRKPQNEKTIVSKAALNLPHFDASVSSVDTLQADASRSFTLWLERTPSSEMMKTGHFITKATKGSGEKAAQLKTGSLCQLPAKKVICRAR
ncbi:hypothetical protein EMCRGX_G005494 [Ephydatia muelleri]